MQHYIMDLHFLSDWQGWVFFLHVTVGRLYVSSEKWLFYSFAYFEKIKQFASFIEKFNT